MSECPICKRKAVRDGSFCEYHELASDNVHSAFETWNVAIPIKWETYLLQLVDEENLGKFAREIVEYLIQQDDSSKSA
ncbi:MAG: hypothetical protein P1Q69_02840 [Candidatus Thorarchaeota archaeon]|nr:hypothetical protein [Candidatus Thorarchaeota archaeon]